MTTTLLLFLYGTLRRGESSYEKLGLARRLRFLTPVAVKGRLFDLGPYPAFVNGNGLVRGELFEPADDTILADLDAFEEYDPGDPGGSLYLREVIPLIGSPREAFIYRYSASVDGFAEIASGDWVAYRQKRDKGG